MVLDLLLIGLGITLEPFSVTAFILVLSAEKGPRKGLPFILGWLGCLVLVIALVILVTQGEPLRPSTAVLSVKLALGVLLIMIALRQQRRAGRPRKPPAWTAVLSVRLSLGSAAGLAAFLPPWALVAAGAATVTQARHLSTVGSYLALMSFCLLATSLSCTWRCTPPSLPPWPPRGWSDCGPGWRPTRIR